MSVLSPFLCNPFCPPKSNPRYKSFSSQSTVHLQNPLPTATKSVQRPYISAQENPNLLNEWRHFLQISIGSGDFHLGLAIHAFLVKSGCQNDVFPGNNLLNFHAKFNRLDDAQRVLDEMPIRNDITWTTLMNGYSQINDFQSMFRVAREMHQYGEKFNEYTCTVVLRACGTLRDQIRGEQVHGLVVKSGFETNIVVGTALVSIYRGTDSMGEVEMVFDGLSGIDIQFWNSMILGYGKIGDGKKAILAFCNLLESGLEPNDYTFTNVISACSGAIGLDACRQLHAFAMKYGCVCDISVGNALITMYGEYGLVEEAERMFFAMSDRNLVSWTALLSAYVKNGYCVQAIDGFVEMHHLGISPDSSCLSTAIDACSEHRNLELGFQIHGLVVKLGYLSDVFVATALINIYAKCGNIKSSTLVFCGLSCQNIISFNALLGGCTQSNGYEEGYILNLLNEQRLVGMKPDSTTFVHLLSLSADRASMVRGRCSHAYTIKAGFEAYNAVGNAVITMYAKCGSINDALQMFYNMVNRDPITWNAMVSAYALHGQGKEALVLFEEMERERYVPDGVTLLAVLQACSHSGLYENGFRLFNDMQRKYGIEPGIEHQACMVDLIGRAGNLPEALEFVKRSQFAACPLLWRTLVSACKIHGDMNVGKLASENLLNLAPQEAASYILVSNMYARGGMLQESAKVRVMMNDRKVRKEAGCSWIEINNQVHRFVAGGKHHLQSMEIYAKLDDLNSKMEEKDIFL